MAGAAGSSETLTLSQLCACLSVSPRQVQYLRESKIVVPSVVRHGRGRACLYSFEDVLLVYIALTELHFMDGDTKRAVLKSLSLSDPVAKINIGTVTQLFINVEELRNVVQAVLVDINK